MRATGLALVGLGFDVTATTQVVVAAGVAGFVFALVVFFGVAGLVVLVALLVVVVVPLLILVVVLAVAIPVSALFVAVAAERVARHHEREDQDETYRKSRNHGFLPEKSRSLHQLPPWPTRCRADLMKGPP